MCVCALRERTNNRTIYDQHIYTVSENHFGLVFVSLSETLSLSHWVGGVS